MILHNINEQVSIDTLEWTFRNYSDTTVAARFFDQELIQGLFERMKDDTYSLYIQSQDAILIFSRMHIYLFPMDKYYSRHSMDTFYPYSINHNELNETNLSAVLTKDERHVIIIPTTVDYEETDRSIWILNLYHPYHLRKAVIKLPPLIDSIGIRYISAATGGIVDEMIVCGYCRRLERKIKNKRGKSYHSYRKSSQYHRYNQKEMSEDIMGIICWYYESEWLHLFLCNDANDPINMNNFKLDNNDSNGETMCNEINWSHFMIPMLAVL